MPHGAVISAFYDWIAACNWECVLNLMNKTSPPLRFAILTLAAASVALGQQSSKIDKNLEGKSPDTPLQVLVQYSQTPDARNIAAAIRQGARLRRTLNAVNTVAYTVPAKALAVLANDPEVRRIMPDREVTANASSSPSNAVLLNGDE